jgi:hypothetical protein
MKKCEKNMQRKAVEILEALDALLQTQQEKYDMGSLTAPFVGISPDWGPYSWTLDVGRYHTHVGNPDGNLESLVDGLHDQLCKGRGMSWHYDG